MDLRPFYPPRPEESRKGDFGRVLVAGGSARYAGAPAFNALAALRAGADMAIVAAPRRAADIVASYAPDLITIPLDAPHPTLDALAPLLDDVDALVLGCGVERTQAAHEELRRIMRACETPMAIDAEALRALAGHDALLAGKAALLTPHGGEWAALMGRPWPVEEAARIEAARETARRYRATVIVKGRWEVIAECAEPGRHHMDREGSPYLTKGGYGDLLAGVAGARLARGDEPYDAARVAAFVVGAAGARAARELGESTLASDALANFPHVLPRHDG